MPSVPAASSSLSNVGEECLVCDTRIVLVRKEGILCEEMFG